MTDDRPYATPLSGSAPAYDTSRVHVGAMMWGAAAFALGLLFLLWVVWRYQATTSPLAAPGAPVLPQPLQPSVHHPTLPWEDVAALKARQMERLRGGDPEHDRLPIDTAIDRLLESGALTRPWTNPQTQPYTRPSTEPHLPAVENRT